MVYKFILGFLAAYISLLSCCSSIIRNDITDRCLHLRSYRDHDHPGKVPVYGRGCTWDISLRNYKGLSNPNEHTEIVTSHVTDTVLKEDLTFSIRKVEDSSKIPAYDTCLISLNGHPSVSSNCSDYHATFKIELVPQTNFKSSLTSPVSFKIINREGYCLTVRPGEESLQFLQCSPRHGLFQVWNVCRHNRKCDVDLMWTPRKIRFPSNSSANSSESKVVSELENDQGWSLAGRPPLPLPLPPSSPPSSNGISANCPEITATSPENSQIINELLYTIQNAVKIYDNGERFLVSNIIAFYPKEFIIEAFDITKSLCKTERFSCEICLDQMASSSLQLTGIAENLLKWMADCNIGPRRKEFLSKQVLQVLLHLFPAHESFLRSLPRNDAKLKMIKKSVRKYLEILELKLADRDEHTTRPSSQIFNGGMEVETTTEVTSETVNSNSEDSREREEYFKIPVLLDIDIRLGSGKLQNYSS